MKSMLKRIDLNVRSLREELTSSLEALRVDQVITNEIQSGEGDKLKGKVTSLEKENKGLQISNKKNEDKVAQANGKVKQLELSITALQKTLANSNAERTKQSEKLQEIQKKASDAKDKVEKLTKTVSALKVTNAKLETQCKNSETSQSIDVCSVDKRKTITVGDKPDSDCNPILKALMQAISEEKEEVSHTSKHTIPKYFIRDKRCWKLVKAVHSYSTALEKNEFMVESLSTKGFFLKAEYEEFNIMDL